jgi:hypothetical protein
VNIYKLGTFQDVYDILTDEPLMFDTEWVIDKVDLTKHNARQGE